MMLDRFDEAMILVFSIWFLAQGCLFAMIWQTSRISMVGKHRTRLSRAQHDLAGGLVIVMGALGTAYAFRWLAGPEDGAMWASPPFRVGVRVILVIGMVISTWAGVRVVAALLDRSRKSNSGFGISQERILATVAVDLPMIVSDQGGTIRYATRPMETLVGATPGELAGLNLTEIMPDRYKAAHRSGFATYLQTGDSNILGKVVNVDALRRDGSEIPISLALTVSEADDQQYFIGLMWERDAWDLPGMNVRQDARGVSQDDREHLQNEEDANLEIRRESQDRREKRQDQRDEKQDAEEPP